MGVLRRLVGGATAPHETRAAAVATFRIPVRVLSASVVAVSALAVLAGPASAGPVRVTPGQTLTSIAAQYGTTVTALVASNGITDPNIIVTGSVLQVPTPVVTSVTVNIGDTLSAIAQQFGVTLGSLVADNDIADPNTIFPGEVLTLPTGAHAATATIAGTGSGTATGATNGSEAAPATVVVEPGQTLSIIAARYGVSVTELASTNDIADPNVVESGATLRVPSTATVTTDTPSDTTSTASSTGGASWPTTLLNYPERLQYLSDFENAASTYNVPLSLLEGVCLWESGWQPTVVSVTGAIGICQVEPYVATYVDTVLEPGADLDVETVAGNIDMSAALLHSLLSMTGGDRGLAVAGYYQGLSSVMAFGMYSTTRVYVHGILELTTEFAAIN